MGSEKGVLFSWNLPKLGMDLLATRTTLAGFYRLGRVFGCVLGRILERIHMIRRTSRLDWSVPAVLCCFYPRSTPTQPRKPGNHPFQPRVFKHVFAGPFQHAEHPPALPGQLPRLPCPPPAAQSHSPLFSSFAAAAGLSAAAAPPPSSSSSSSLPHRSAFFSFAFGLAFATSGASSSSSSAITTAKRQDEHSAEKLLVVGAVRCMRKSVGRDRSRRRMQHEADHAQHGVGGAPSKTDFLTTGAAFFSVSPSFFFDRAFFSLRGVRPNTQSNGRTDTSNPIIQPYPTTSRPRRKASKKRRHRTPLGES